MDKWYLDPPRSLEKSGVPFLLKKLQKTDKARRLHKGPSSQIRFSQEREETDKTERSFERKEDKINCDLEESLPRIYTSVFLDKTACLFEHIF